MGDADYLLHVLDLTTGTITQVTHPAPDSPYTTDMDPDWSPDGTTIAFGRMASSADGQATQQIGFLTYRGPHRGEVRVLPFATGPDDPCFLFQIGRRDPSFSPDGRSIAYAANGTPFSMSVRSGTGPALAVAGSPARLTGSLTDCAVEGVWVSPVTGHEAERAIAPQLGDATGPSWSPDGASIALVAPGGTYVVPLDGGAPIPISDSAGRRPAPGSAPGAGGHTGWDPAVPALRHLR